MPKTRTRRLYTAIADTAVALANCRKANNAEWEDRHNAMLDELESLLPHGSGLDGVVSIDVDKTDEYRIVIGTAFHHMNDTGMYDGWTEHTITVRASFVGDLSITISGRDRNAIKDYLADTFDQALRVLVTDDQDGKVYIPTGAYTATGAPS